MERPRLRQLDLKPANMEGEELFYLSDPTGIVEDVLVLHPGAVFIAMHLDGQHDLDEIHRNVEAQFNGESLPENTVRDFVAQLDSYGFMDSPTYEAMHEAVVQGFYDSPTPKRLPIASSKHKARFQTVSFYSPSVQFNRSISYYNSIPAHLEKAFGYAKCLQL